MITASSWDCNGLSFFLFSLITLPKIKKHGFPDVVFLFFYILIFYVKLSRSTLEVDNLKLTNNKNQEKERRIIEFIKYYFLELLKDIEKNIFFRLLAEKEIQLLKTVSPAPVEGEEDPTAKEEEGKIHPRKRKKKMQSPICPFSLPLFLHSDGKD